MTRRDDSLIGQIVAANVVLVALTLFAASLAAGLDLTVDRPALDVPDPGARDRAHAVREPVDAPAPLRAARAPDRADRGHRPRRAVDPLELPDQRPGRGDRQAVAAPSTACSSASRRSAAAPGTLAMRAQEEERRRLARDLHDEVNQALTAILLRLEALAQDSRPSANMAEVAELKRLVNQAMEELLNLARQLRPTALDDHGLMPAIETQLKRFSARTGVEVRARHRGRPRRRCPRTCRPPSTGSSRRRSRTSAATPAPRRSTVEIEADGRAARAARPRRRRGLRPGGARAPRERRRPGAGLGPERHGRARPPGRRRARRALRPRRRHDRDAPHRRAREGAT